MSWMVAVRVSRGPCHQESALLFTIVGRLQTWRLAQLWVLEQRLPWRYPKLIDSVWDRHSATARTRTTSVNQVTTSNTQSTCVNRLVSKIWYVQLTCIAHCCQDDGEQPRGYSAPQLWTYFLDTPGVWGANRDCLWVGSAEASVLCLILLSTCRGMFSRLMVNYYSWCFSISWTHGSLSKRLSEEGWG
jgi:hypothetical protein